MSNRVNPIPAGYRSVTPYLCVRGAAQAIEFYKKAFGAEELSRMPAPDGRLGHAELKIGDSMIMLSDEFPEMGGKSAQALGGTPVGIMLYVENVDAVYERAVSAGATSKQPPTDQFWGDRFCRLTDPFGLDWSLATHIEDIAPEEMARRSAEAMKDPSKKSAN